MCCVPGEVYVPAFLAGPLDTLPSCLRSILWGVSRRALGLALRLALYDSHPGALLALRVFHVELEDAVDLP